MTTNTNTFKASEYTKIVTQGLAQMRKGAMNTIFAYATATLKKGDVLNTFDVAQILGWTGENSPRLSSATNGVKTTDLEHKFATKAKKQKSFSNTIHQCLPHLDPVFLTLIEGLHSLLNSSVKFNAEVEKIVKSFSFFKESDITTQKELLEFFESYLPEGSVPTEDTTPTEETKPAATFVELPPEEDKKPAKTNPTELSENSILAMAQDAIQLLVDENPTLSAAFIEADKADTKEQAVLAIATAFNEQLKAARAEIEVLTKIKTPTTSTAKTPRKSNRKTPANPAMAEALEKATA